MLKLLSTLKMRYVLDFRLLVEFTPKPYKKSKKIQAINKIKNFQLNQP